MGLFNSSEVSDSQFPLFPNGLYQVKIREIRDDHDRSGLRVFPIVLDVVKAADPTFEGAIWKHNAYVGTYADPDAAQAETRKKSGGLRLLKRICRATGVDFDQEPEAVCQQLVDREFVGKQVQRPDKNNTGGNDDKFYNNLTWAYAIGEAQPVLFDGAAGRARPVTTAATPARPATAPKFGPVQSDLE